MAKVDRVSPYKKAKRYLVAGVALALSLPYAFGFNVIFAMADWFVGNWPKVLIVGALALWFAKNNLGE